MFLQQATKSTSHCKPCDTEWSWVLTQTWGTKLLPDGKRSGVLPSLEQLASFSDSEQQITYVHAHMYFILCTEYFTTVASELQQQQQQQNESGLKLARCFAGICNRHSPNSTIWPAQEGTSWIYPSWFADFITYSLQFLTHALSNLCYLHEITHALVKVGLLYPQKPMFEIGQRENSTVLSFVLSDYTT